MKPPLLTQPVAALPVFAGENKKASPPRPRNFGAPE
jgi:hypothetical protein